MKNVCKIKVATLKEGIKSFFTHLTLSYNVKLKRNNNN